jgi:hypothetical protein
VDDRTGFAAQLQCHGREVRRRGLHNELPDFVEPVKNR